MNEYLIGVDIGGTTAKIGFFDRDNISEFIIKNAVPTRTDSNGVHILPDIAEEIAVLAEEAGIRMEDVQGIGIGVPGPVITDKETGHFLVNHCVNLHWGLKDVSGELSELTGIDRVVLLNDANAAALGEVICGTNRMLAEESGSYQDMTAVVITIGTGIGGGVVIDGEVMQGAFGAAGEIGHMKVAPQHPLLNEIISADPDVISAFEDLEYYTSATGIARVASAALKVLPYDSVMRDMTVDARTVFDAAKGGDELALKVVDLFADTLGTGLAAVSSVIDPHTYIVGGGVAAAGDFLLSRLDAAFKRSVFHASKDAVVRLAVLGNDAGMIGSACALL